MKILALVAASLVSAATNAQQATALSTPAARGPTSGTNQLQLVPDHVTISVADLAKERAWYEHLFGVQDVFDFKRPGFEASHLSLGTSLNDFHIDLVWNQASSRPTVAGEHPEQHEAVKDEPAGAIRQGWVNAVFKTPAIDAAYRRLSESGTHVGVDHNDRGLIWRLYFRDPEGNEIQINALEGKDRSETANGQQPAGPSMPPASGTASGERSAPAALNPLQLLPDHMTLSVADLAQEQAWYQRMFGLRDILHLKRPGFEVSHMSLGQSLHDFHIDLVRKQGSSRPMLPGERAGQRPAAKEETAGSIRQGWVDVVLKTPVIDEVYKRLSEQGSDVRADRNNKGLVWRLYLHDPEGNEVQVNAIGGQNRS